MRIPLFSSQNVAGSTDILQYHKFGLGFDSSLAHTSLGLDSIPPSHGLGLVLVSVNVVLTTTQLSS